MLTVKSAQSESCELFYLGSNEDYSLRDSISDGSEKLLPRCEQESSVLCVTLVKGGTYHQAHISPEACCLSQGADVTTTDVNALVSCPWICSGVF